MNDTDTRQGEILAFVRARLDEDELWAKAASAGRRPEDGTVEGGVHWTWAVGDNWEPVEPDPLEPYIGGGDHGNVYLRTVEEWQLTWGGDGNTLAHQFLESEELRTADGAHIVRHDPARVLRDVAAKRAILAGYESYLAEEASASDPEEHVRYYLLGLGNAWWPVIRALAGAWADHPDWQPAWHDDRDAWPLPKA